MGQHEHHDHLSGAALSGAATVKDPVCGMKVNPATAAGSIERHGTTYYFCSQKCLAKFRQNPEQFVGDSPKSVVQASPGLSAPPGTQYTCPMHPEIVRDAAGVCPLCGMALEPIAPLAESPDANPELLDMTRRFWIGVALTTPLLLVMLAEFVPAIDPMRVLGHSALAWAQLDLGESRVIVDRDVDVLPTGTLVAMHAILQDALADLPEAAQLLDVQVHQLTDRRVLVAVGRRPGQSLSPRAVIPP